MAKFKNVPKRTTIDLPGASEIYVRQFKASTEGLLLDDIKAKIKKYGKCECGCNTPLAGKCDWDHHIPNALQNQKPGSPPPKIEWRSLLPGCHKIKSRGDVFEISKQKRTAKRYNPEALDDYVDPEFSDEKPKKKSGGLPPKPEGYKYQWGKRKPYEDNTKVLD